MTHVDLVPSEADEREAWTWLDGEERRRARRFRHTGARRRYVLCRASLRSLLCGALNCRNQQLALGASEHGKPFATVDGLQAPIAFNVSHSGQHGLIALAPVDLWVLMSRNEPRNAISTCWSMRSSAPASGPR